MKKEILNFLTIGALLGTVVLSSCSDDNGGDPITDPEEQEDRFITVAGALMGDNPGDGNGGTMVYSVTKEEAQNPDTQISVYTEGFGVKSNRTAHLQSSEDGSVLFNIAYTGDNGGEFSRYTVNGGGSFAQSDVSVNISQYAGTSPRWLKLYDGDKTGVALNVANIKANNAPAGSTPNASFAYYRGVATVLALDLQESLIKSYQQYEIPLTNEEEAAGHTIFRLDGSVLNKAEDKLIIGTWMRKYNTVTGETEGDYDRLGTKSVVVDYPSFANPTVITSTVSHGDNSGYRSHYSYLGDDGNIYQATERDPAGSHILKINQSNEYDNSYVFSLNQALGLTGVTIEAWQYAQGGKAFALISHDAAVNGFIVWMDLNAKTASIVDIPYDVDLEFNQYQGFVVDGKNVYIAVTPVGKNGNIYIMDSNTGVATKGATLVNQPGNHYIGIF
ncbi:hypothetical protein LV84_02031 [Algoriphagus ratkowskyi]|uniref:DUF4374 domain-containing protein n=1 Tax=Algoriphagus ratkowskyi TaxID=57028 RepID=A0A2W7T149_9BACT|nr:hypothetical protein [Algoriphagus ratkowskyi]PZX56902.1 hypothetical protein LV84_02031 [Algoriphagus ratkowskyi]TXD79816.1 hypothetical protein ESW18_01405 [Algoriphagus ratkowskyi]